MLMLFEWFPVGRIVSVMIRIDRLIHINLNVLKKWAKLGKGYKIAGSLDDFSLC